MATLAPAPPKYSTCPEKKLLTQAFLDALLRLLDMQERHAAILMQGIQEVEDLKMAIEEALKERDRAREAYILHVRQHVC